MVETTREISTKALKNLRERASKDHPTLDSQERFLKWLVDYIVDSHEELFDEYNITL
jgi:hypothetical protein